ncbi:MAG: transketolase C-terminal domain-containing protein [Bacilli bacterium]
MRNSFINETAKFAKKDKEIMMITADLGYGVLKEFYEEIPNQFINCGIAEQNMASISAGMALAGKKPYIYSINNFASLRCIEQIRNDILYHNANVKIITVGAGFGYGALGMSHHGTEDLSIMRCLPNLIVFSPGDKYEAKRVAELAYRINKPCYVRLGKGGEKNIHSKNLNFKIGQAIKIVEGDEIAVLSTGPIGGIAFDSVKSLIKKGKSVSFYTFPTIKPIDAKCIKEIAERHELIVSIEENNIVGGLGSAVAEIIAEDHYKSRLLRIGINDEYVCKVGSQDYLRKTYKIDEQGIIKTILKELK